MNSRSVQLDAWEGFENGRLGFLELGRRGAECNGEFTESF
jgi:hypothetical protein